MTFRLSGVLRAAVPETAVNEDNDMGAAEDEVCGAAQTGHGALIDPEAQASSVQPAAQGELWGGVAPGLST